MPIIIMFFDIDLFNLILAYLYFSLKIQSSMYNFLAFCSIIL